MCVNNCATKIKQEGKKLPMKWHKFLVYFFLIYGVVVNVVKSFFCFAEMFKVDIVFNLRMIDFIYGLAILAFSVFIIFTWWLLKNFKRKAQVCILVMFVVNSFIDIVYDISIFVEKASHTRWDEYSVIMLIISIAANIFLTEVMVNCNKDYYGKRAHLFVN